MLGALIMISVLLVILPLAFLAGGTIAAVVLGQSLWRHGETRAEGSELVELNR